MLRTGERVGRYEVEALLGQGGLAEVYRVRHAQLGGLHALKLLTWRRKSLADRLLLEGRIQAQLRHPNVVTVTDVVEHDGRFGLLMEYVDSQNLEEVLAQGVPPLDKALDLFASILAGVAAAHEAGVLHRDLKPANILLAAAHGGVVPKVTDFGIAKVVHEDMEADGATKMGITMGTPGYMAPEQIRDAADVDARADVFALCAIGYELISGWRAFADDEGNVSVESTLGTPRPLLEVCPECPPALAEAIMAGMARDRADRPADAKALAMRVFADRPQLLDRILATMMTTLSLTGESPGQARPPGHVTALTLEPREEAPDTFDAGTLDPPEAAPPPRWPWVVAGVATLGLLGAGVLGLVAVALVLGSRPDVPDPVEVTEIPEPPTTAAPVEATPLPPAPIEAVAPEPPAAEPSDPPTPKTRPAQPAVAEVEPPPEPASPPEAAEPPAEPAPAAPPEPEAPEPDRTAWMAGQWVGTADKRPFRLRLGEATRGSLRGEAVFVLGPSERVVSVAGTYDPATGALMLRADDSSLELTGTARPGSLSGTYTNGKKSWPWEVSR